MIQQFSLYLQSDVISVHVLSDLCYICIYLGVCSVLRPFVLAVGLEVGDVVLEAGVPQQLFNLRAEDLLVHVRRLMTIFRNKTFIMKLFCNLKVYLKY